MGVKVYETNDINEGWDGTYKGQQAPVDTYGYYGLQQIVYKVENYR